MNSKLQIKQNQGDDSRLPFPKGREQLWATNGVGFV